MEALEPYRAALLQYLQSGRPFFGICVGMQSLFDGSDESPEAKGLGFFPGRVRRFDDEVKSVPHMGWNTCHVKPEDAGHIDGSHHYYFVHSYAVPVSEMRDEQDILCFVGKYNA